MPVAQPQPYTNSRFLVEIDGMTQTGFSEVSGFGSEVEVIEYREGGDPTTVHKLTGRTQYPNITLKRGLTQSRELYDWHLSALTGQVQRKNGRITLLDDTGTPVLRWLFRNAWPTKWYGPALNAKANDVAIESLEIACEELVLE